MDAIKSELLILTFEFISNYTLLLQNERLTKLRFTPLPTTVYHTYPTLLLATTCPQLVPLITHAASKTLQWLNTTEHDC